MGHWLVRDQRVKRWGEVIGWEGGVAGPHSNSCSCPMPHRKGGLGGVYPFFDVSSGVDEVAASACCAGGILNRLVRQGFVHP